MVLKKLFGIKDREEDIDIDRYMDNLTMSEAEFIERDDITYVKPVDIDKEGNIDAVLTEIGKRNIVVLNVRDILNDKALLRKVIRNMEDVCTDINGDMGRISYEKILVVPQGIKIVHRA